MAAKPGITVYHNPACGTSRNVLAAIRAAGHEPVVVEYLKTGWQEKQLRALLRQAGASPRDWLREKGSPAAELGLLDPAVDDETILQAMLKHPILVNRPVVVTAKGTALCRPADKVAGLL